MIKQTAISTALVAIAGYALAQTYPNPTLNGANITGIPISGIAGLGTNVATGLGTALSTAGGFLGFSYLGGNVATAIHSATNGANGVVQLNSLGFQPSSDHVGVATGADAASGNVGQYLVGDVPLGSAGSASSGVITNLASISLTAGDWDVWCNVITLPAGSTTTQSIVAGVNSSSTAFSSTATELNTTYSGVSAAGLSKSVLTPTTHIDIGTTTPYYCNYQVNFSLSTMTVYGAMQGRRVR